MARQKNENEIRREMRELGDMALQDCISDCEAAIAADSTNPNNKYFATEARLAAEELGEREDDGRILNDRHNDCHCF